MPEPILELRHLRMVSAIVDAGTVTGAAAHLHLTQSAVSHALRDLERRLGTELFERNGRRMHLTVAGERVAQTARSAIAEVDRLESDLEAVRSGRCGTLRISMQCYTSYHWLVQVLPRFQDAFEGIDLQIHPEATPDPVELLHDGRIQLAIVTSAPSHASVLAEALFDDEMVLVTAPGHALARRACIEPPDLAAEHVFVHTEPDRSFAMAAFLAPAGVRPAKVSRLSMTEALFETIRAGLGVSIVSRWMAAADEQSQRLACVPLCGDVGGRTWYAATLRRNYRSAPLALLIELLRDAGA